MNFNSLYDNYIDDELDVRLALEATGIDPTIAAEAAKIYQQDKSQDFIFAERALAKGSSFATVKKSIESNIKRRANSRPRFDNKLRKALIQSKKLPDIVNSYHAHHIVPKGDRRSRQAVAILAALGIDIDDPANGVFLPANEESKKKGALRHAFIHTTIHTKPYHANISFQVVTLYQQTASMSKTDQKTEMLELLDDIAEQLKNGSFPIYTYIPGAERFA